MRMRMRSLSAACAAALLVAAAAGAAVVRAGDDDDEAVRIKIATQAPKGTLWMDALDDLAADIKKQTKVEFVYFPGGAQGDEKTVARKIQLKSLGGGLFTGIGLGEILSEVRILELPFFYESPDEIDQVKAKLEPQLTADFEKAGYVFMGWAEVGAAFIFSKDESKNLDDLKKRKIWLWQGDPLAEATFKEFGLSGTPLALADVITSLNTGLIDAVYNSPYGLIGLQWHSHIKYMSRMSVGHGTGALLLSKKEFDKIPAKKRDKVKKIARDRLDKLTVDIRQKNEDSVKELEEHHGVKVIPIPDDEIKMYREHGANVAKAMAGKLEDGKLYTQDMYDNTVKIVEDLRAAKKQK
jgi:TRAP-type C4-dicarboxylate transport system substrate-binding protein